jgi:DNA segregation ATPase FtsK/SpoIIIE, S-DNA-T family
MARTKDKKRISNKKTDAGNREIKGVIYFACSLLIMISMYFGGAIAPVGLAIRKLLSGFFGLPAFVVPILLMLISIVYLLNKINNRFRRFVFLSFTFLMLISGFLQISVYSESIYKDNLLSLIGGFFINGIDLKGGGLFGGLITWPFIMLLRTLGTIIILLALSVINIMLLTNLSIVNTGKSIKNKTKEAMDAIGNLQEKFAVEKNSEDNKASKARVNAKDISVPSEINNKRKWNFPVDDQEAMEVSAGFDTGVKKSPDNFFQQGIIENDKNDENNNDVGEDKNEDDEGVNGVTINKKNNTGKYVYPPVRLLKASPPISKKAGGSAFNPAQSAQKLEQVLGEYGIEASVVDISVGPSVTRYELTPKAGVVVSRIVNRANDISLRLAAQSVRIEAPIPGRGTIGIEVANSEANAVFLRDVIDTPEFKNCPSSVSFALGKDVSGKTYIGDLKEWLHVLIAGATGAGKSVCINSLIISLIYKASPEEVKFLIIDPKRVELQGYNGIPHLLIPVITEPKKAAGALNWAVQEMIRRYEVFSQKNVKDLEGYNKLLSNNNEEGHLPKIVIIIDELSDLMMTCQNEVEDAICRLAQMARAAGMHLVIATQRPSVDVITGIIKANIPSRISFRTASQIDSRTILDSSGAEKLIGKGDMLIQPMGKAKPFRLQGAYISESEINEVIAYVKEKYDNNYDEDVFEQINNKEVVPENKSSECDELLSQAIEMTVEKQMASVSFIQRKFQVGYARAARIVDQMEQRGIVGGYEGSKPRQVLVSREEWQEMQMRSDA